MIDEKKIEEAAQAIYKECFDDEFVNRARKSAFKAGANWAIQEFLKDLWHPASEKPKFLGKEVLIDMEVSNKQHSTVQIYMEGQELPPTLESVRWITDWKSFIKGNGKVNVKQWLYIDDLLPNQKGK